MTAMVWAESAEVEEGSSAGTFVIPAVALFADEAGKSHVWVVDMQANTVQKRAVETGDLSGDDGIRVTDGLKAGEMVAVSAVSRLREGMVIKPVDKVEF
jgi:multidrug efflux pump subunit AcrA (membrane-fusion protein)